MSKRASIRSPIRVADPEARKCLGDIVDAIEQITGQRGNRIEPLPANATLSQVIEKVNEIAKRIQG